MPPSYVEEVPATWPQNLALIRHEVSELERNGRASADRHYAHLKELVRTTLVTHSWRRLAIDLLFVMKYPRLCDMIVANASDLSKTVPDDATVSAFLAAFRQHPDYLGLYVCMHYCERLRFAVCRDPELRPLLRHGLDAALKWLSTPAGRQEFDSLTLREIGKADKPVVLRSVCDCVSWVVFAHDLADVDDRPELFECFLQPLPGADLSYASHLVRVLALGEPDAAKNIGGLLAAHRVRGTRGAHLPAAFDGVGVRLFYKLCAQPAALDHAADWTRALAKSIRTLKGLDDVQANHTWLNLLTVTKIIELVECGLEAGVPPGAAAASSSCNSSSAAPQPASPPAPPPPPPPPPAVEADGARDRSLRAFFGSKLWLEVKALARVDGRLQCCFHMLPLDLPISPEYYYRAVVAACRVVVLGSQQLPTGVEIGDPQLLRHAEEQIAAAAEMLSKKSFMTAGLSASGAPSKSNVRRTMMTPCLHELASAVAAAIEAAPADTFSDSDSQRKFGAELAKRLASNMLSTAVDHNPDKFKTCWSCGKKGSSSGSSSARDPAAAEAVPQPADASSAGGGSSSGSADPAAVAAVKLHKCSRCREAMYCNADCQRQHWKIHKRSCVKRDTAAAAEGCC